MREIIKQEIDNMMPHVLSRFNRDVDNLITEFLPKISLFNEMKSKEFNEAVAYFISCLKDNL